MKLPTSSGKQKKPRVLIIRRVKGESMLPSLKPEQLVLASSLIKLKTGRIVIARHGGIEVIKRLSKMSQNKVYITGDNPSKSTDSRDYGWINKDDIVATVIWPKQA